MLPPPPLTDPDEQVSRIRFFTREFRQRPCSDERYLAPPPRQVGYPSSLCGQVCGVQCPLPCFRPTVLSPWRLPSLHRVPVSPGSPTSRGTDEGATTSCACIPGPLWIRFRAPHAPPSSCSPKRSRRGRGPPPDLGSLVSRYAPLRQFAHGHARDLSGFLAFPPVPLPGSQTPAGSAGPRHLQSCRCCPRTQHAEGSSTNMMSGLNPGLRYLLPTLHERRRRHPCKARFRPAGCAFTGRELNPLDRTERFQATSVLLSRTFLTQAGLTPSSCRSPLGQSAGSLRASSQANNWSLVSATFPTLSTRHQRFTRVRLTSAHLTGYPRLFRNAHYPGRCASAACGGLDPDPAIRVRGASPHLLCSKAASSWLCYIRASSSRRRGAQISA